MGLRESNAQRNREWILDAAMALFQERGYNDTTLEQVAERAEVSISTLYRYFPTKDLLLLAPVAFNGQMAVELASRPVDESLEEALGHAVLALLAATAADPQRLQLIGQFISTSEPLRARMREQFVRERIALQEAVATRLGRPEDDIYCSMVARSALSVIELAGGRAIATGPDGPQSIVDVAIDIMRVLHDERPAFPQFAQPDRS